MPGADAAFYEYARVMNLENWEFVPESMRSDKIFDRMLVSPWNATAAIPARIPPLVLQLGPRKDCDNDARVLAAVRHSGYNLQFASARLRADASVVAWAAATEDVKQVTVQDARDINMWCERFLNSGAPSNVEYEESRERCKMQLRRYIATLSLTNPRSAPEGLPVPACKAAAYFAVPAPMRERLWPWRQRHLEIFAQLQREGKMPTPPSCNECSTLKAPAACNNFKAAQLQREGKMPTPPSCNECSRQQAPSALDNFKAALWPVLQEMHPELSGDQSRLDMLHVIWGIWSELSVNDEAQWARRA
jgi:hypothetical protein